MMAGERRAGDEEITSFLGKGGEERGRSPTDFVKEAKKGGVRDRVQAED